MPSAPESLPSDLAAAHAMILAERLARLSAEGKLASACADLDEARPERSAPLLVELETWLREQRNKLSRSSNVLKPINYMLNRWAGFARFTEDGRICMTNNAAERSLRGLALGRRAWLFAGSDRGAKRAAVMLTLIMTARLNEVDPKAWLADVSRQQQTNGTLRS
jgi:Transposase IS66 family